MPSRRGVAAALCVVVIVATAMAPLAAAAFCAELVPVPALFGEVIFAPLPEPAPPRVLAPRLSSPLPDRAPPAA